MCPKVSPQPAADEVGRITPASLSQGCGPVVHVGSPAKSAVLVVTRLTAHSSSAPSFPDSLPIPSLPGFSSLSSYIQTPHQVPGPGARPTAHGRIICHTRVPLPCCLPACQVLEGDFGISSRASHNFFSRKLLELTALLCTPSPASLPPQPRPAASLLI